MQSYVQPGNNLEVTVNSPAVPTSGVPCRFGSLCGVALLAEGEGGVSAATKTMVKFDGGVYDLSVTDTATGGIAIGDQIWFHDANPPLLNNVAASGYSFGVALEVITTGATATINVLHIPRHGLGTTPADTTVTTAKLVADNVTAAKLTATLRTGFVPLDIFNARVIGTNEIAAVVGAATDPILSRDNAATDKAGRLSWASASVLEIQLPTVCYPPDLDDAAAIVVHVLAKMKGGSVDIPVIAVGAWEGVGGSNVGGNTAALSTTLQDLSVTIAAGSVSAAPQPLAITLKPGTHATGNNDVYVYGAWLTYTRK